MISAETLNSVSLSLDTEGFLRTEMHASGLDGFKQLGDSS